MRHTGFRRYRRKRSRHENIFEIQTRIKSRKRYNESSSFSNDLMKRKSFRALRGRGKLYSDEDYFRERYNESSCFSNNLMKCQSFRASRARMGGGKTEFRRGLRVENGTTNRLLSLMI